MLYSQNGYSYNRNKEQSTVTIYLWLINTSLLIHTKDIVLYCLGLTLFLVHTHSITVYTKLMKENYFLEMKNVEMGEATMQKNIYNYKRKNLNDNANLPSPHTPCSSELIVSTNSDQKQVLTLLNKPSPLPTCNPVAN